MSRPHICIIRQRVAAIAAAVAGLNSARIALGLVSLDDDDEFFHTLRSKGPASIAVDGAVATATFAKAHGFTVGQLVTIDCAALETVNAAYIGAHAVATVPDSTTLTWAITPSATPATIAVAAGDLIFTTPYLVIQPAEQSKYSYGSGLSEMTVELLLYFGVESDTSYDWLAVESLVYRLRDALSLDGNYTTCPSPDDLKIPRPQLLRRDKPMAGLYKLTLSFLGV